MKPTGTSEKELERLIVSHLAGISDASTHCRKHGAGTFAHSCAGQLFAGASIYNRDVALDAMQLLPFLKTVPPQAGASARSVLTVE
ncbi:MAG: hypothetical protein FWG56_02435 [Desulfovibrionaceae bacterium]|nr:hypothetical protein [Desulfovibrionaceae bacterium]